jgi:two-component system sensor kinase FixL
MAKAASTIVEGDPLDVGELQQYLRLAATACDFGTWHWNLRTGWISCSTRAAALLGLASIEAVGRDALLAGLDLTDRHAVALALDDAAAGQGFAVDIRRGGAVGEPTRVRLVGMVSRDAAGQPHHVLGLVTAARQDTEGDHARRLLAAIVASSDDGIISKTMDGVVTGWNPGAERIFGYRSEEIVGGPVAVLAMPGREDEMPAILDRLRRGDRIDHYETTRRHKDGRELQVSLTVLPIYDEDGHVIGASKVVRDITEVRLGADALRAAQVRLQEQQNELLHVARLSELGQMAATLAHEVNQPLAAISNYLRAGLRLLAQDGPAARSKLDEAIGKAADQAARAGEIIRRLRSLAKRSESDPRPESIDRIVDEAIALAAIDARQRGVQLRIDPAAADELVLADRVQIQQVLLNLTRNALEAMEGEPRRELLVTTAARDGVVEVSVRDTGPGLAPDVVERLFQPFVTTKDSGMGIGLSICRKIIDAHGGRLWAAGNPGGGTIFTFTLRSLPRG